MKFQGKITEMYDGENCAVIGKLTRDGVTQDIESTTSGQDMEFELDGRPVRLVSVQLEIGDFLAEHWPDSDDPRWTVREEDGTEVREIQDISLGS